MLILGNGPSLSQSLKELGFLDRHKTVCVNYFPATEDFTKIKPAFFVVSAPELWLNGVEEVYVQMRKDIISSLITKTSWPLEIFIAKEAAKHPDWRMLTAKNSMIKVVWYNIQPAEGFRWFRHVFFNAQWGMPRPHNVLIPAIMLGIRSGFSNIYLLGADHSWLPQITVDDQNTVLINQKHFYDADKSRPDVMRKLGSGSRKLHEVLQKFQYTFESYFVIQEYANSRKTRIINATPGSFIDAFERINTEELRLRLGNS
ncbi:MAG: hypothetical protein ACK40M_03210 [Flavobacteriales bacterium]